VQISSKKNLFWAIIGAILVILCYLVIRPFLEVILWTVLLAIFFRRLYWEINERLRNKNLSALISAVLVTCLVVVPLWLLLSALVGQLSQFVDALRKGGLTSDLDSLLKSNRVRCSAYDWLDARFGMDRIASLARSNLQRIADYVLNRVGSAVQWLFGSILDAFLVLISLFFFFRDWDLIVAKLKALIPLPGEEVDWVFRRTRDVIHASIYGRGVTAMAQGTLSGLAFWVLGLQGALLWGAVTAVISLIPMLGPFVIWIPAAIYLALKGSIIKSLLLVIWGAAVVGLVDNFLYPTLVGSRTRMHTLLILFTILGGIQAFGVIGIFLGPLVFALGLSLLERFSQGKGDQ